MQPVDLFANKSTKKAEDLFALVSSNVIFNVKSESCDGGHGITFSFIKSSDS